MKRLTLASIAVLALTSSAFAASYVPLGPKVYTPQPPTVTPQAPTVTPQDPTITVTGGGAASAGSSESHIGNPNPAGKGWFNAECDGIANYNADCTVQLEVNASGGTPIPVVTTVTANPDLVTPNPDLVTPNPPTCTRFGWSAQGGFGQYGC